MTEKKTVLHCKIPIIQNEFINRMVLTPSFESKAHVVKFALHKLQKEIEGESH